MDWTFTIGSMTFGILDIITLVILFLGGISGCVTGFSTSATRLVGLLCSIPIALLFTKNLSSFIVSRTGAPAFLITYAVFVGISAVVYLLISRMCSPISKLLGSFKAFSLDNILGFFWGLFASAILLSLILLILSNQTFFDFSPIMDKSAIITDLIKPLFPTLKDSFSEAFNGI